MNNLNKPVILTNPVLNQNKVYKKRNTSSSTPEMKRTYEIMFDMSVGCIQLLSSETCIQFPAYIEL